MGDRLDHAVLLVGGHLGHQAKIKDDQSAVGGAQHVARVRVGVEESCVEQLRQVGDHSEVDKLVDVVRLGLRQLLAVDPLGRVHAPRRELRVILGDDDARQLGHVLGHPDAVLTLEVVVEFLVEVAGELINQVDEVNPLRQRRAAQQHPQLPREVQVERHCLEHKRPLHLDGHLVTRRTQRRLVNLPERRGRDGLRRDGGENVCDGRAELVRHRGHREARVERRHLVAELLKLHHGLR
mmetsp:Transcript_53039/g.156713  ORF Transcript_53039/g.156713 Transcript_53039/m.156713 type:complete len:238 (-) Transcript_53039:631-1344(-)